MKDLAFEAALDAQRRDQEHDFCEEDFVDLDDLPCQHATNKALCEAIMEKARSYSIDEVYSARAYKRAAEKVSALTASVFSLSDKEQRCLGVGPKTKGFVYGWILKAKPESLTHILRDRHLYTNTRTMLMMILDTLQTQLLPNGYTDLVNAIEKAISDIETGWEATPREIVGWPRLEMMMKDMFAMMDGVEVTRKVLIDTIDFLKHYYARNSFSLIMILDECMMTLPSKKV